VWVWFGGDGVMQGCLVWLVRCEHDHDACVECGGRRGQDVGGAWNVRKPRRWLREEKGPSCVYQCRERQVRAGGGACAAVAAWCT
jgi:hypothetical protein